MGRAMRGDQSGPPAKNPTVCKVGAQDALTGGVSDQDDADSRREGDNSGESSCSGWAEHGGCDESSGGKKASRKGDRLGSTVGGSMSHSSENDSPSSP